MMSIIKNSPNPESARAFYDFASQADIQVLAANAAAYQVPSNTGAPRPPQAPKLEDIKLIDYDFKAYGSSDTRRRLLKRWDDEVGSLPN